MKRLLIVIPVLAGIFWAVPAQAARPYFEFNPDYSESLLVASGQTVAEVFLPLNEFLSGFDFWVSNAGQTGEVTFTFFNPASTQIAENVVTVPAIADSETGTRLHLNLPNQTAVNGAQAYSVGVSTAVPTFRLYYADQNQLLAHNATPSQTYTGGLARLGGQDKGFGFKFALYETHENTPPVISNVTTSQTTLDEVLLKFNVNEPADYRVQYGNQLADWTGFYTACLPTIQFCTATLPVTPATTYPYTLTIRDIWGNQATATGTFTSLDYGQTPIPTPGSTSSPQATPSLTPSVTPTPDLAAPVITNKRIANLTPTSADFAWTTNEAANTTVVVQLTPVLITVGGNTDATLELEHFISINGLTRDTHYQATLTSSDGSQNSSHDTITFLTPKNTPTPTPTPTISPTPSTSSGPAISPQGTPAEDPANPILDWTPPAGGEPSNGYRVDIFDQNNKLVQSLTLPAGTHRTQLVGLPEGQQRAVVYANNAGTFQKVATPTTVHVRKKSFLENLYDHIFYIVGGFVLLIILAITGLALHKPKKSVPPKISPIPPVV